MITYYSLIVYCKVNQLWSIEFGDYDYKKVKQEEGNYPDKKCKILTTVNYLGHYPYELHYIQESIKNLVDAINKKDKTK